MNNIQVNSHKICTGAQLVDRVYETMEANQPTNIQDKQAWRRAGVLVYEIFCCNEDCQINIKNFIWVKNQAIEGIRHKAELGMHPECDQICQRVGEIFDRLFVEEVNLANPQTAISNTSASSSPEPAPCTHFAETSHPPRSLSIFIHEIKAALATAEDSEGWNEAVSTVNQTLSRAGMDCLLTYQIFDQIKKNACGQLPSGNAPSSKIREKMEKIFDETFARVKWNNILNKNNIQEFLQLYRNFVIKNDEDREESCLFKTQTWILNEDHAFSLEKMYNCEFDYRNLEVTLPLEKIQEIYHVHGVVQLRPIDPSAKILIIGCGNGRLSCGGGSSLAFDNPMILFGKETLGIYNRDYSIKHQHPGAITIDPSLSANPTILGYFGNQPLSPLFKGQKFDTIIFEGYFDSRQQRFRKSDLANLLSEQGAIYEDLGLGPKKLSAESARIIQDDLL